MLILTRKIDEAIVIDGSIRVKVIGFKGNQVRLGIEAPKGVSVNREEVQLRIDEFADNDILTIPK